MTFTADQMVRDIAARHPAAVRVFESLGIDYCCGGLRPLSEACRASAVPVERALALLNQMKLDETNPIFPAEEEPDWSRARLADLAAYIVSRHHEFIRGEAPRLQNLAGKVALRHAAHHPELETIRIVFTDLARELSAHMTKEENVLFPYIGQMESAVLAGEPVPPPFFGTVRNPIACMVAEHDDAGELLTRIRNLSANFRAPADACASFTAFYHGLEEFERDLHRHIHLENNILFPRATNLEAKTTERGAVRD
ncbi:MAG TPA: iron-sulfur cluster repair di-iron protein [Bryobacteraceae bacterium]|nr:iron-sulfur cluster repair di-iron protein [Bryobacteraceae bacterium]